MFLFTLVFDRRSPQWVQRWFTFIQPAEVQMCETKWNEKQSALDLHVYVYLFLCGRQWNEHWTKRKSNSHEKKKKIWKKDQIRHINDFRLLKDIVYWRLVFESRQLAAHKKNRRKNKIKQWLNVLLKLIPSVLRLLRAIINQPQLSLQPRNCQRDLNDLPNRYHFSRYIHVFKCFQD